MLLSGLPYVVLFFASGVMGCWIAVTQDGIGGGWVVVAFMMATGLAAVCFFISGWRARHWVTAFDSSGFWWMRGEEVALIRWGALAGVGIYWAKGTQSMVHTVELCPLEEIDRDDPLLWKFVRDTDPLRPGLPRLRYRVSVGYHHKAYEQALMRWAPELWFERKEQPLSYRGDPDETGHRERTAVRTATTARTPEPLVFDGVDIGDVVIVHRGTILVRRRLYVALPTMALCAWGIWTLLHDPGNGTGAVVRYVVAAPGVLLAGLMVVFVASGVREDWRRVVTMDAAGIHVTRRGRFATLPWTSLSAVGIHEVRPLFVLGLCPEGEIERHDPLMGLWVRDSGPPRRGLPRPGYSVSIRPAHARHAVAAGCRRWAPQLWRGGERVPSENEEGGDLKHRRDRMSKDGGAVGAPAAYGPVDAASSEGSDSPGLTPEA